MAFAAGFGQPGGVFNRLGAASADHNVAEPPSEAVSSLGFCPVAQLLAATSWDGKVSCWEVDAQGKAAPKAAFSQPLPVLCSAWSSDGRTLFTGKPSAESLLLLHPSGSPMPALAMHQAGCVIHSQLGLCSFSG